MSATELISVGLDIGATKVHGVAVDADGAILAEHREPTQLGPDGVVRSAAAVVAALASAGVPGPVGVGVPGLVDPDRGTVKYAVNLGLNGDWVPLGEMLADRLGTSVMVENDVNAATLGAHLIAGADDVAYVSLGTGLAAGMVLGGVLRRGFHGAAGEIGHLPVDPNGAQCSCGQRGCLELVASGSALAAAWPSADQPPAQALFAAAAGGDECAIQVRDRFAAGVADAVRVIALAVDPRAIVIGGGVAALGEPLRLAVSAALARQAESSPFLASLDLPGRVQVVPTGVPIAALGAALLGRKS
ncbi:ROK family protein [Nocardioides sp. Iso805N]|uniref:ROK family protein n=1 Tax=Nocardioides sp. Iso805N TaxID=1283287 RepID=UPI0003A789A4|nr:ROK family protein [Nocardioides sp. Iso805N]